MTCSCQYRHSSSTNYTSEKAQGFMLLQLQKKDNVKIPVSLSKTVVLLKSHRNTLNHFALLKGLTPLPHLFYQTGAYLYHRDQ